MNVSNYKELLVWKKGMDIAGMVQDFSERQQNIKRCVLMEHAERTAISIPSNIAEGAVRQYNKEYIQHCYIALGSCEELETQLVLAMRKKRLNQEEFDSVSELLNHESRMLMNLIKALKGKKR